jgi:hypothetical protein
VSKFTEPNQVTTTIYSTRTVADMLGTKEWRVRRLFESGDLPEPKRFGGKRCITPELIPAIVDRLRDRGWLPESEAAAHA